jgi:signal transduction histidine kinase
MSTSLVMRAVLVATIAVGISGGLLAWRERPEPGAGPLTAFLVGACWWSAALFFQLNSTTVQEKVFWVDVSWVGVAVIPVAWLFFCLSYGGYSEYLEPRYVAGASAIPALTVLLALTNGAHGLLYTGSALVDHAGRTVLYRAPGPWFWVIAGYTYLLGLAGAITLLRFVSSKLSTFRGQCLALLVGLVTPWVTNVLYLAGVIPTGGIDPTPVAFSVSALAFLGALTRFRLFDTSPAAIRPARRQLVDRMDAGVVVLDRRNNVIDLNGRAAAAINGPDDPLGSDVGAIDRRLGVLVTEGTRAGTTTFQPTDGETYDVAVSELTDTHGRTVGRVITLHDISEYLRQQQQLEVLNRLFRHNVRTNSQVVVGHVDYLAAHNSEARAEEAHAKVMEIVEFSDKIRAVLDVFERGREAPRPVRLGRLVESAVDLVRATYPDVTVAHADFPEEVYVNAIAGDVLRNAVENAAQHNTSPAPEVGITAEVDPDGERVRVTIEDNGPGIDEEELALLNEGSETPLNHGTGLGLALIVWSSEILGGRVSIADREPCGTVVTVELPTLPPESPP